MESIATALPAGLAALSFDNTFLRELPGDAEPRNFVRQVPGACWSRVDPTPVAQPRLLAWSREMASTLGLDGADVVSDAFARIFGGNGLLPGMQPFAGNYGGHQFGHWAGQLGDGRAISLGEAVVAGQRHELQLKGAGPTPYSRSADGRAVLRSSIREFVCSEAMHHLGIPTTRALCLVGTGEGVVRDMFYDGHPEVEPGAIVCRVAPSFLRFGHFELPYARGDTALLQKLADFCLWRDFPELAGVPPGQAFPAFRAEPRDWQALYARWFAEVCTRTARLVSEWMRVGFVHGVLNTDNMSMLGLTIDYGPYGWIDDYDPDWTPNTTDAQGRRYRFGWQPRIAQWNLLQLAQALSPLFGDPARLQAGLEAYATAYVAADRDVIARKLGLRACRDDDVGLMRDLHGLMQAHAIDMTLWFRALCDVDADAASTLAPFEQAFYDGGKRADGEAALVAWLDRYRARLLGDEMPAAERRRVMQAANPCYVPRNWLAQEAIDRANGGDLGGVEALLDVMRRPYEEQPGRAHYAGGRPDWARDKPGCAMLSCSS